jgi:hypothetical protein
MLLVGGFIRAQTDIEICAGLQRLRVANASFAVPGRSASARPATGNRWGDMDRSVLKEEVSAGSKTAKCALHVEFRIEVTAKAVDVHLGAMLQQKEQGVLEGKPQLAVHDVVAEALGVRQRLRGLRRIDQLPEIVWAWERSGRGRVRPKRPGSRQAARSLQRMFRRLLGRMMTRPLTRPASPMECIEVAAHRSPQGRGRPSPIIPLTLGQSGRREEAG